MANYLAGIKEGDKLWDLLNHEWVMVKSIYGDVIFLVNGATCTMDGKQQDRDAVPRYLWKAVHIHLPEKPKIEKEFEVKAWLNVYKGGAIFVHASKEDAERNRDVDKIGETVFFTKKIRYYE